MMRYTTALAGALLMSALIGCTKGDPTFTVLDQSAIPQITFQNQTERSITVSGLSTPTAITGECDARVRGIAVVAVDTGLRGSLDAISMVAPTVRCAEGTFAFTLKPLNVIFTPAVANQTYVIEFRAETAGGISSPSRLKLTYVRELPNRMRLSSGGLESGVVSRLAVSTTFRADVHLTHLIDATDGNVGRASSTNFKLRYGRAQDTVP